MKVFLENNTPKTNAIMGALISGGDAMMLARMLTDEEVTE